MAAAKNIVGSGGKASDCIFCKIAEGGMPSYKVYEDSNIVAFLDIYPIHSGHVLVVPKRHSVDIFDTPDDVLQQVMAAARKISPAVMKATKADGINIGMNNRPASGQVVMHIHLHIIPRFKDDGLKTWPQRPYNNDAEKAHVMERIRAAR